MSERPQWNERNELLSELYTLRNHLIGQIGEVDLAIMREKNAHDAKIAQTVTQQTKELLNRSQKVIPLWTTTQYQQQAMEQSDAKQMENPPYDHLVQ